MCTPYVYSRAEVELRALKAEVAACKRQLRFEDLVAQATRWGLAPSERMTMLIAQQVEHMAHHTEARDLPMIS